MRGYGVYLGLARTKNYFKRVLKALLKPAGVIEIDIGRVLEGMSAAGEIRTFLQVGANDGMKNDPLRPLILRHKLKGILVEPFHENFEKLKFNYSGVPEGLIFEEAGIGDSETELDFYYIDGVRDDEPDWYDQVGSFDKATFISNISVVPELSNRIAIRRIPCHTIRHVLKKHGFEGVDFIHLDAEGYDFRILQTIDFSHSSPRVILFETDWMRLHEWKLTKSMLEKAGYRIFTEGIDCLAVHFVS